MTHPAKRHRHPTPQHRQVAQTYAERIVIGKALLVAGACVALVAVFLLGSVRSAPALVVLALGALCAVLAFVGDFPASVRCPECGARMKARTNRDPQPRRRLRHLDCPQCHRTIDL